MKISKEHILAFKISILLLIFAFSISIGIQYLNEIDILNFNRSSNNKFFIFIILSFIIYFVSYYLAKFTIAPIELNNKKLKEYNHNLAHEIKTPLSVIKINLELLEIGYDKKLIESTQEEISAINDITDSLLFLSENNELKSSEICNIKELLNKYLGEDIELILLSDFIINGNKNLIDRLLKNIIENARKFTENNRTIKIIINSNSLNISNTFKGDIKSSDIENITDIFYQADNSRSIHGYGLGLSIVDKICNIHNLDLNIKVKNNIFNLEIKK